MVPIHLRFYCVSGYPPPTSTPPSHRAFGMVAEVSGYGAEGGEGLRASTGQVVSLLAQKLDNMLIKNLKKKVGFLQMWFIKLP